MILNSNRLLLVPATLEMIEAEISSPNHLAELLNVQKPYKWPPPLNDKNSQKFYLDFVTKYPKDFGWGMWYFLLKNKSEHNDILVGNGGFKGLPNKSGEVEIGYSVVELYHKRGIATEAVSGLIEWAFSHDNVKVVTAQTLVGLRPSIRVLEKCKFSFAGNSDKYGVIRFELKKENIINER